MPLSPPPPGRVPVARGAVSTRDSARQPPDRAPAPPRPRPLCPRPVPPSPARSPAVPTPRCPALQCPAVPAPPPPARPPASTAGRFPKTSAPAGRCCRAVPGCTGSAAGTDTHPHRPHTPADTPHSPPGARSPPRHHRPGLAGRVPGPGAARPPRGAGDAPGEGDAPREGSRSGRASAPAGAEPEQAPRAAPVPSARPARPAAEPRAPLVGSALRRTWRGETAAPRLRLRAGIGGSPAAPSWRAGGGATAVGWARVPSVFSTAPPQGKKQVIPGSSIISYRRISHFLPPP